ncbi:MAG: hypothetical protein IT385_22740 [Deltaproteobacteria bacterium]|nr:hypothetical protein [Deltaproteobacteria bacterium]
MTRLVAAISLTAVVAPASASDTWFVRADGVRFNSDVGAWCGALNTDIFFEPSETSLDIHDEAPLDFLVECLTRGELRGAVIAVVAPYDGSSWDYERAQERQAAVIAYLMRGGVDLRQLDAWKIASGGTPWEPDRIRFRIATLPLEPF